MLTAEYTRFEGECPPRTSPDNKLELLGHQRNRMSLAHVDLEFVAVVESLSAALAFPKQLRMVS